MAALLVEAGVVMMPHFLASKAAHISLEISINFLLILLHLLIDSQLASVGRRERELLGLRDLLNEVRGLRLSVDV